MAKKYIIQKAVSPDKVKKGFVKPLSTYQQQAKYDGCCAIIIIKEGEFRTGLSRTGECYISLNPIGQALAKSGYFGSVAVIGEFWREGRTFAEISGAFRRFSEEHDYRLIINDVIPLEDFERGRCEIPYVERVADYKRYAMAHASLQRGNGKDYRFDWVDTWFPGSGDPQERCNFLVEQGGFDGLILRDLAGTWTAGSGTTGELLKVKRKISFDLQVLEVNEGIGEKTGRPVYTLVVGFNGKRLGVGSGIPFQRENVPNVGDIVEVEAMDYSEEGLLREPRFKGVRYDKLEPDC